MTRRHCFYLTALTLAVLFAPTPMEKFVGIVGIILCLFI